MRVIPKTPAKKIAFFQCLVAKWTENPTAIGLDAAVIAEIEAKIAAAKEAAAAQLAAQSLARTKTATFHSMADELASAGAKAIQTIRAKAAGADDNEIYSLAFLPPPKKGAPVDAPGRPTNFTSKLGGLGELELKWKCKNPSNAEGTVYEVLRSVDGGAFAHLGIAGTKKYTDYRLPQGAKEVMYRVRGIRSTRRGPVGNYTLAIGVSPGDEAIVRYCEQREAA